ncbi:MAG: cation:proton antiporter [Proteobacteria bacterium]|nr:cation:proton antiporter [Pseudomonadota bacterium]
MPISELVLVVTGLLAISMLAASLTRNSPIPYTVFLVVLGILLSSMADFVPGLGALKEFQLTPDLVFFIFLPALIFESALNLDARQLLKDIAPIFILAAPALVISTAIIGLGIWLYLDLDLILALLFGALISATDPVAVVALFKELGAPARLNTLVEGESLFNDATAIVLFNILLGIALAGSFAANDIGYAVVQFLQVFFGGIIVGSLIGFGLAEIMRRIRGSNLAIIVMSLVIAYSSFVIAEHVLHVSGVMAAMSAAVAMGAYAVSRIPPDALHSVHETWEVISLVCNSLLFLMIGLSVDLTAMVGHIDGIIVASLLVLIARAATVYSLVPGTIRLFSLPHVSLGERHIMWWGGLKGGLAIAIVLSIPESLGQRQLLVELTVGVVLFTLLVNAPSIRPLIKRLGIDRLSEEEITELQRGLVDAEQSSKSVVERLTKANLLTQEHAQEIAQTLSGHFKSDVRHPDTGLHLRHAYVEAIDLEAQELDKLYELGLIMEYTFLDLRAQLHRQREAWMAAEFNEVTIDGDSISNPFQGFERTVLRWMREHNTLAPVLARVQRARLSQAVQRDIAGILCGEAVISNLVAISGLRAEDVAIVVDHYQEKIKQKRVFLNQTRSDFPEFFRSLEGYLTQAAALASAGSFARRSYHHGDIGAKAFSRIDEVLRAARSKLPEIKNPDRVFGAAELIERVPLFSGLDHVVLTELADQSQTITFLTGDEVIGQNQRGNALYIIVKGSVAVSREEDDVVINIGGLVAGDFFGEAALLGDEIRTARVVATSPLTLLRLTRKNVLELAENHPGINEKLNAAYVARAEGQTNKN